MHQLHRRLVVGPVQEAGRGKATEMGMAMGKASHCTSNRNLHNNYRTSCIENCIDMGCWDCKKNHTRIASKWPLRKQNCSQNSNHRIECNRDCTDTSPPAGNTLNIQRQSRYPQSS